MKVLNRKQGIIFSILIILFVMGCFVGIWSEKANQVVATEQEVRTVDFSHDSGWYSETLTVNLYAQGAETILYTLDGSTPHKENETAILYDMNSGIELECTPQEMVYTIKAVAYTKDGSTSVATGTYIIGDKVQQRYKIPVLSVSGNPNDFFSDEDGILVMENGNRFLKGREYEKEVQMTLFDESGSAVLSQNCGFRVYGNFSRNKNQPSFRLYARSEYDEQNDFEYALFKNQYTNENALFSEYKRIIVRNSGDDNGYSYLRSELASRLAIEAGFQDAQCASPVCVYINGEYYGVYWFVTNYDEWYFAEKYGDYEGQMVTLEGVVALVEEQEEEDEVTAQLREEYNALHEFAAYSDLNVEENWEALNERIDVENFLQYVALQNYFCNGDAFTNNFKTYRYYSPEEEYQEETVFDGRYRFMLYDLDETLGFGETSDVSLMTNADRMGYDIFYNALFANVMKRPECREYYIRYYLSLVNCYCSEERAVPIMEEMHESHADELRYLYNNTDLLEGNVSTPENVDYNHALSELEKIRYFLTNRPKYAYQDLSMAFGLGETYELFISNNNEDNVSVDFATFYDKEFSGKYYEEIPVMISVTPKCGYKFDYWLVNGIVVEDARFWISADMIEEGIVSIECVSSPDPEVDLYVTAFKSNGGNDYVELTNFGQNTVNLRDFFLSDGPKNWNSSSLPALEVGAGESIKIYCKSYTGVEAIGEPGVGFNLKEGEMVNLYRSNGELLQSVPVPKLSTKESVYRINIHNGVFSEQLM